MLTKIKIFFASRNKAKWPYFQRWCRLIRYQQVTPYDIKTEIWPRFKENGKTIEENAQIKAINWSKVVKNAFVLANDCGVKIPALGNNWQEQLTKRQVGGEQGSDLDKIRTLLKLMQNLKGEERRIQWSDAIAIALNGKLLGSITALSPIGYVVEKIPPKPKIIPGAPLATIEYKPQFNKVYSELTEEEIEQHDAETTKKFQEFIKKKIEENKFFKVS